MHAMKKFKETSGQPVVLQNESQNEATVSTRRSVRVVSKRRSSTNQNISTSDPIQQSEVRSTVGVCDRIEMEGGKWRRTLFELRKSRLTQSSRRSEQEDFGKRSSMFRRKSLNVKSIVDRKTVGAVPNDDRGSLALDEFDAEPYISPFSDSFFDDVPTSHDFNSQNDFKTQLLKRCGQNQILSFNKTYSASKLKKCRKIGEGAFGEVFLNEKSFESPVVLKIIPIEGDIDINAAQQKKFEDILHEVIISQTLSDLRDGKENQTAGFVEVLSVRLVKGSYPAHLLKLWHEYDDKCKSKNDSPAIFKEEQLYVVFELANGGRNLENHKFDNVEQTYSAYLQVTASLAIAESKHEFEHRDLHWGNVLVAPTTDEWLTFTLNGIPIEIRTYGIKATIIDYTLSRMIYRDCCLYQDLAADPELFDATGDYQYDIYRYMRTKTNDCWELFKPVTNILWLHYLIEKMIKNVRDSSRDFPETAAVNACYIENMMILRDHLTKFKSSTEFCENFFS